MKIGQKFIVKKNNTFFLEEIWPNPFVVFERTPRAKKLQKDLTIAPIEKSVVFFYEQVVIIMQIFRFCEILEKIRQRKPQ